ncbi:MAG TPA: PQQ-binding-like beta-propeller repeat protein, partial [Candidatus Scalindua sp.]|nr:PQQ-binding-like beta-propeller repeat protein [Candidatus Scalindua sp.]
MFTKTFLKIFNVLLATLVLVAGLGVHFSIANSADSPWQMFRHDLRHTGISPFKGAQTNKLKWKFEVEKRITSSPAIGLDGTIYFGSVDGKLYAVSSEGKLVWTFQTGGEVTSSPAIGPDGKIYFGSRDKKLYAISSDGSLKWAYETEGEIYSSPTIGKDNTVYFGSADGNLYATD